MGGEELMNQWPYVVKPVKKEEIGPYCVDDPEWQQFRLSLKGMSTEQKLDALDARRYTMGMIGTFNRKAEVQIDNYINALRRGGQLNTDNMVVK
jgi:hypothetical protein